MVSVKLSSTEAQSYYVLRLFVLLHLLGFACLAVLLGGLNGVTLFFLTLFLGLCVPFGYQIFNAAVRKSIYGHWVLTRDTLAFKAPGKPRVFYKRRNCTGLISHRCRLVFKGRRVFSLRLPGKGEYATKELLDCVARTWWPRFYKGPTWKTLTDHKILVQIRFVHGDEVTPPLMFAHPGKSEKLLFGVIGVTFYALAIWESTHALSFSHNSRFPVLHMAASIALCLFFLAFGVVAIRKIWHNRKKVQSPRFVMVTPGAAWVGRHGSTLNHLYARDLRTFDPLWGVYTANESKNAQSYGPGEVFPAICLSGWVHLARVYWPGCADALTIKWEELRGSDTVLGGFWVIWLTPIFLSDISYTEGIPVRPGIMALLLVVAMIYIRYFVSEVPVSGEGQPQG